MTAQASARRRPGAGGGSAGWDAVVVGARVAGASTALPLARAGLRVLVVDRARRGSDTLSTHALMRGGVLQLRRWGLLDRVAATGAPPVRRVTFHYGAEPMPVSLKPYAGVMPCTRRVAPSSMPCSSTPPRTPARDSASASP